jgi:hypothetical protein
VHGKNNADLKGQAGIVRFAGCDQCHRGSVVSEMGIDPEAMKKVGPPERPVFELINDLVPEPDCQEADKLAAALRDIFDLT